MVEEEGSQVVRPEHELQVSPTRKRSELPVSSITSKSLAGVPTEIEAE